MVRWMYFNIAKINKTWSYIWKHYINLQCKKPETKEGKLH